MEQTQHDQHSSNGRVYLPGEPVSHEEGHERQTNPLLAAIVPILLVFAALFIARRVLRGSAA